MSLTALNNTSRLPGLEEVKKVKKSNHTAEEKTFAKNSNSAWN